MRLYLSCRATAHSAQVCSSFMAGCISLLKSSTMEPCSSSSPQGLVFSVPASAFLCFHFCCNKGSKATEHTSLSLSPCFAIRAHSHCCKIQQNGLANKSHDFSLNLHCCATRSQFRRSCSFATHKRHESADRVAKVLG